MSRLWLGLSDLRLDLIEFIRAKFRIYSHPFIARCPAAGTNSDAQLAFLSANVR